MLVAGWPGREILDSREQMSYVIAVRHQISKRLGATPVHSPKFSTSASPSQLITLEQDDVTRLRANRWRTKTNAQQLRGRLPVHPRRSQRGHVSDEACFRSFIQQSTVDDFSAQVTSSKTQDLLPRAVAPFCFAESDTALQLPGNVVLHCLRISSSRWR